MEYYQAREYLKKVNIYGSVLGLDSIYELLKRLGNPQQSLKVVHIAGTNGKGSVGAFLQSILIKAGYKVGRYSSPAVFAPREIITINGQNINEEDYGKGIGNIKKCCDEMVHEELAHPTPFEIETALAFMYFANNNCDICLVECGMGGESDATNVFDNVLCSVITSISMDHTQFLGNTINEIANIKAGIIKPNSTVVSAPQLDDVKKVIKDKADNLNSKLIIAPSIDTLKYNLKMKGSFQLINVSVAIEVAKVLDNIGYNVRNFIKLGVEEAVWPGRMELVSETPLIIIDGAHNPAAVYELDKTIDLYFTNKRIAFIMGVLSDKDFKKEAEIIAQKAVKIITVTPNNHRGLNAEVLRDTLVEFNPNVVAAQTIADGLRLAKDVINNKEADMIIAFGSLSYLSDLKNLVQKAKASNS